MKKSQSSKKQVADKTCIERLCQIMNYSAIICLLVSSIVRFTIFGKEKKPSDPFFYLLTFYLIPFAVLILCAELKWQKMLKYFEFMGYLHGKGLFFIFVEQCCVRIAAVYFFQSGQRACEFISFFSQVLLHILCSSVKILHQ